MPIRPPKRDERLGDIWNELMTENQIWALASLKRLRDEFYERQKIVLKLLKDCKANLIVKGSDLILKEYLGDQKSVSEAITWHDLWSLVTIHILLPTVRMLSAIQVVDCHPASNTYSITLGILSKQQEIDPCAFANLNQKF